MPELGSTTSWSTSPPHHAPGPRDPVQQVREEIRTLLSEMAVLARQDVAPEEFEQGFLSRAVAALGAEAGVIWRRVGEQVHPTCHLGLEKAGLDEPQRVEQHQHLLAQVLHSGQHRLLPPGSGVGQEVELLNPTPYLLLLGVIGQSDQQVGLLEVFQRPAAGASSQRGYLRFVEQACRLAGDYYARRRLHAAEHSASFWKNLDRFADAVHESLDPNRVAHVVANEGRRLLGCDRVSVLLRHGSRYRAVAISGLDVLDRRSNVVQRLQKLAAGVAAGGEAVWHRGASEDLPPQIERAVDGYLDAAHSRILGVVPLQSKPDAELSDDQQERIQPIHRGRRRQPLPLGVLVVEQFGGNDQDAFSGHRVERIAHHAARALGNAQQHHDLFLHALWRWLGRRRRSLLGHGLPKTLLLTGCLVAVVAALVLVPADFDVRTPGTLQPVRRRDVFAATDGVVQSVLVRHGQQVAQGQVLAKLRNSELQMRKTDLIGRRESIGKQMRALQRTLLGESRLPVAEESRLSGQLLQLEKAHDSLTKQLELLALKEQQLVVRSDMAGQVVTWDVQQQLLQRPVRTGQMLMSIADPSGPWELDLQIPEHKLGHIVPEHSESEPAEVTFVLATHPERQFRGRITELHAVAEVEQGHGNVVVARASIDRNALPQLQPGASVTAKIHCGQRSLGYVWLADLMAFVQRELLFRF